MARATNGLGQFRGKVGSVVFRVSQGQQIASAYQPAVKNPKSNLQTSQRNKMYLASQISKLVPREDLIGLNPNGSVRDRRSLFIKNIIDNASSTLENGLFTSFVDHNNVVFSNGNEYGLRIEATESGVITITFDKTTVSEELFNRTAIKMAQLTILNNVASLYKSSWLDLGQYDTSTEQTFDVTTNVTILGSTYLYFIPVIVDEGVRYSTEKKTLIQAEDSNYVITGVYAINNAVLQWFKSTAIGPIGNGQEVVPPTGSEDEVVNPDGPNFPNLG